MLDGNDIWEALFGIMKGDVPEELTEDVCEQLAAALASSKPKETELLETIRILICEATEPRTRHELLKDAIARIDATLTNGDG